MTDTVLIALSSASGSLVLCLTTVGLNILWMGKSRNQLRDTVADLRAEFSSETTTGIGALHKHLDQLHVDLQRYLALT